MLWLVLALGIVPHGDAIQERVDLIEVNHVHSTKGNLSYSQAVFYEWRPAICDYQVLAWRLLKEGKAGRPERDWRTGDWLMVFPDGANLRVVRSAAIRESWTTYDLEQAERDRLPKEHRAGLMFERLPLGP